MFTTPYTHPTATWRSDAARVRTVTILPVSVHAFGIEDRSTRRGAPPL